MQEPIEQFEKRKRDHITAALSDECQTAQLNDFNNITLTHEALPELNFNDITIETNFLNTSVKPLFISSMTAGHSDGFRINQNLALAAQKNNWVMGVGSQRRELNDLTAQSEWREVRKIAKNVKLIGNIGITQLITSPIDQIKRLVDSLEACALFIHTNPVQEALQEEGTPQFKGCLKALENICRNLETPVVLKETGCGFSASSLNRLNGIGLYAVDVSGMGGTHWGRIEGFRTTAGHPLKQAAQTFANWGISTTQSLINARDCQKDYKIWASGGVRSGLDAAKCIALGADMVGIAQPLMVAALQDETAVNTCMQQFELTLKMSLFFTGSRNLSELKGVPYVIKK